MADWHEYAEKDTLLVITRTHQAFVHWMRSRGLEKWQGRWCGSAESLDFGRRWTTVIVTDHPPDDLESILYQLRRWSPKEPLYIPTLPPSATDIERARRDLTNLF